MLSKKGQESMQALFLKVVATLLPLLVAGMVVQTTEGRIVHGVVLLLGLAGTVALGRMFWKNRAPAPAVSQAELERRARLMEEFNSNYRNVTTSGIGLLWIGVEAHCAQLAQLADTDHIWQLMAHANVAYSGKEKIRLAQETIRAIESTSIVTVPADKK